MDQICKLQQKLNNEASAFLISDSANRFYLTGMRSSAGTVLITAGKAWLIIDFRYYEEALRSVKNCMVVQEEQLYEQITAFLCQENIRTVFLHAGVMSIEACRQMENKLAMFKVNSSCRLKELLENQRKIKCEEEISWHRIAQQITDHTFSHICNFIKPGMTEIEVAMEIGTMLTKSGSEDKTFNYIVASGKNSSLPHGFAKNKQIQNGDFVTMDFGAVVEGRLADMTRTIAIGKVSNEQRKVYQIVKDAQNFAFEKICPGAVCRDVDAAAREHIYNNGYQGYFSHGLGHSIGVEVHENPRFNETCTECLQPGIVITVEPGIYISQRFGVRIEDMIVVTPDGYENLTKSDKELIIL